MNTTDKRLIEDYLPIVAISAEASREKSVRKGHISTLHLWWARRPLVACRAAVYGALVPASRFVPENGPDNKKQSLGRANAAKFVERLCQYPGSSAVIAEAQKHILEAHAQRLTRELAVHRADRSDPSDLPAWAREFHWPADKTTVTVDDILAGRAPRPRVLDMFAGGGAIPLEALRLGCEAYALDLNPVAHIIELCTLVYPQKYGEPDPNARGMTGPNGTWGGLANEVRYWGNWVLEKVKAEIGDLYPPIPDPSDPPDRSDPADLLGHAPQTCSRGLVPVAYLWTRTVTCKNPNCRASVPLVRQTWLCKKPGRYVALKMIAPRGKKQVRFEVVEARSESGLGFDPAGFSKAGNATCPFCGTVADNDYVKAEGCAGRMGRQLMATVCTRPAKQGKVYLAADPAIPAHPLDDDALRARIEQLCQQTGLTVPEEPMPKPGTLGFRVQPYGVKTWGDLFTPRQMLCLLTFAATVRHAFNQIPGDEEQKKAVGCCLAVLINRQADYNSTLCSWHNTGEKIGHTFGRQALPMIWDFAELAPFGDASGSPEGALEWIVGVADAQTGSGLPAIVTRGSATALPWSAGLLDAVVTDPPYYDNVPYADISDFFYVWLRRTIGHLYPEHFASPGTPKKQEAVADATRHGGSKDRARQAYEQMMAQAFAEAHRVLKPGGQLVIVYAHKTTLGWATLVDALRRAGFVVTEAWPLDTEMKSRLRGMDSAALASSIFLVARKREGAATGNFDEAVKPELDQIVRERVETLWDMGISGADLVISCVGAGLRAFTRFARVEYANGDEVPAERFLSEVETVVLETILARLSKEIGDKSGAGQTSLAGMDPATRFYVLWRYTYGGAELDAGEAIVFANGTHVELEGHHGLAAGRNPVLHKSKSRYRLRDFTERGDDEKLGLPEVVAGTPATLIDALHRLLWLLEHKPPKIPEFLNVAQPNVEQLRLVAQALAGPALKGGELKDVSPTAEQSALGKLLANWSAVIEGQTVKLDRQRGQGRLF